MIFTFFVCVNGRLLVYLCYDLLLVRLHNILFNGQFLHGLRNIISNINNTVNVRFLLERLISQLLLLNDFGLFLNIVILLILFYLCFFNRRFRQGQVKIELGLLIGEATLNGEGTAEGCHVLVTTSNTPNFICQEGLRLNLIGLVNTHVLLVAEHVVLSEAPTVNLIVG